MNTDAPPDFAAHPLALLAHELRTPLNAVVGYADAMRLQAFGPLNAPYDEQARTIHSAALHLLRLVDDMTDIARAEAGLWTGGRERFDPTAVAREIVALLAPRALGAGIALGTDFEAGLGDVVADSRAVGQILINLLDNALKFTAAGGRIELAMSRDEGDLRIVVADSGRGVAAEATDHSRAGQGLGLRLARALATVHDGSLSFTLAPLGGATATVRLPALREA